MKSFVKPKGSVLFVLKNEQGKIIQSFSKDNLIVDLGKNFIASRIIGSSQNVMTHIAIGSVSSVPSSSDTTLESEIARAVLDTATVNENVISLSVAFAAGVGTGTIREAGIFNDANPLNSIMLSKISQFAPVNKTEFDTLSIYWNIEIN